MFWARFSAHSEAVILGEGKAKRQGLEQAWAGAGVNAEFQRIASRDKKAFFSDQCKEIEDNIRWDMKPELAEF